MSDERYPAGGRRQHDITALARCRDRTRLLLMAGWGLVKSAYQRVELAVLHRRQERGNGYS